MPDSKLGPIEFLNKDTEHSSSLVFNNSDFIDHIRIILDLSNSQPPDLSFSPKSVAQSTQNQSTQDSRNCQFYFDEEVDKILANLNLEGYYSSSSPNAYQFWPLLSQELENLDQDSPEADVISSLAFKSKNHVFDDKEEFNFDTCQLNAEHLREYGLSQNSLDISEKGIPINFKAGFHPDKIRTTPNTRSVNNNKVVVSKVLSTLVASGHVSPVTYKPTVLSHLNVTSKANGSPRLIHDLSRLNRGVVRGPRCSLSVI